MSIDELIAGFNKIRDIPYSIPIKDGDTDSCCNGKSIMLKSFLENKGLEARYRVCEFYWNELGLPKEVMRFSKVNLSTHVYIEAKINDKWIDLDPSWDIGLKNILRVAVWDGRSSTKLAVPVTKKYTLSESEKIMNGELEIEAEKDEWKNEQFYRKFNEWVARVRI